MTIRLTSRCLALGGLGGLPNSFTSSPGPSIQARFSSAQVGKPSSTSASAYMANKKAQETERSNPAEEEFLSFARRLNDARVQKAMNTMLPPKTSSSPTEDVLTITDLENRAAFDVNKLLDTGAPPTVLSSELLGELLAGTRVRYFIGAVLLIVGVYTTTRLELFREWLVLGVFDSERCFVAYAGRAQRAKWALVDELEALAGDPRWRTLNQQWPWSRKKTLRDLAAARVSVLARYQAEIAEAATTAAVDGVLPVAEAVTLVEESVYLPAATRMLLRTRLQELSRAPNPTPPQDAGGVTER
eukprot:TRINITY_DN301_c0_g2_i1.p1 TRINITY_DN301_c0_g2~~TRINITY_DN301_c0_g2_i1.p1  ORF type:complete len:301 (+),score=28.66 TRINITY_DN301_c0_g2_i1:179-1081(+)